MSGQVRGASDPGAPMVNSRRTVASADPPLWTWAASAVQTIWSAPRGVTSSAASGTRSSMTRPSRVTSTLVKATGAISVRRPESPGPVSSSVSASVIVPRRPVSRSVARSPPSSSTKYSVVPGATPVGARPSSLTPESATPQPASSSARAAIQIRLMSPPGRREGAA